MAAVDADRLLIARIRAGEQEAWAECIARFEGRLLAFVDSRLRDKAASEDVVQETFLGFLVGLPNYDDTTPPETFLFSIAAHKLTDVLRRKGRRPTAARRCRWWPATPGTTILTSRATTAAPRAWPAAANGAPQKKKCCGRG
jgi:DNA-directed RNA polymerase specialized sigma24 family protein